MNDLEIMTDSALMSRVAVGEDGAIGPLVRRYERPLLSLLMRLTQRRAPFERGSSRLRGTS